MNTTILLQNLQKQLRMSNVATTAKDKIPNQQTSHWARIYHLPVLLLPGTTAPDIFRHENVSRNSSFQAPSGSRHPPLSQAGLLVSLCNGMEESVSRSVVSDSCDPMDCCLPGSSVHGILQARIPAWVAISFSRGSFQPRDWTLVSCIASRFFILWATREA